ncbi:MAG: PEP-CTERM sorting domain-containing protein [Planctomycetia bacterium]|nr:PEP-CTERM sorting domain-containing protein [Planctomycetia bacterium]
MKKLFALFAVVGLLAVGSQVKADPFPAPGVLGPVKTIAGAGSYKLVSDGKTVTIDFQSNTDVFQLNDVIGDDAPTLFTTISMNAGAGPNYTYTGLTITETISGLPGGGTVVFELTGATAKLLTSTTLELKGTKELISNTTGYDFSPFDLGGLFTFTLNDTHARFASVIANGGSFTTSGSFDEIAAVPEPASMAMLTIGGLLAGAYGVRRRKN